MTAIQPRHGGDGRHLRHAMSVRLAVGPGNPGMTRKQPNPRAHLSNMDLT